MKEPHASMQSTAACKHTSPFGHPCGKGCLHENRTSSTSASTTRVNWLMHHVMHAGCHTKCAIGLKPHAQKPSECTGRFLQEGPSRTRNGQFAARYMQARMPAETVQKTQMVHTARERNNLCTNACAHLASRQSHAKVSKRARRTRIERFGRLNVANFACQQG